jgi:hypothetical protein
MSPKRRWFRNRLLYRHRTIKQQQIPLMELEKSRDSRSYNLSTNECSLKKYCPRNTTLQIFHSKIQVTGFVANSVTDLSFRKIEIGCLGNQDQINYYD